MPEPYGWIFVDFIPLIHDKKRLAKQVQIETWLNLTEVIRELGLERSASDKAQTTMPPPSYIV